MLAWTLHLWSEGRVSPGDVILTLAMAFRILHGSRDLAFALVNASQFIARIADAIQVIGENHRVVDRPGARPADPLGRQHRVRDVDFSYPGGEPVVRGFTLRIEPGAACRPGRAVGRRQIDVDQPAAATGRCRWRPGADR